MTELETAMRNEEFEDLFRSAVSHRVDQRMSTGSIAPERDWRTSDHQPRNSRRAAVAFAAITAAGFGAGTTLQLATSTNEERTVKVSTITTDTTFDSVPRLLSQSPGYVLDGFSRIPPAYSKSHSALHVRTQDGWFDVQFSTDGRNLALGTMGGLTKVMVGGVTGYLHRSNDRSQWFLTWQRGATVLDARGPGEPSDEVFAALGNLQLDAYGRVEPSSFPIPLTPLPVEPRQVVVLGYVDDGSTDGSNSGSFSVAIEERESYANDYEKTTASLMRGDRKYFTTEVPIDGAGMFSNVSWNVNESWRVTVGGPLPLSEALDLADAVQPASPEDWAKAEAVGNPDTRPPKPTRQTLMDGTLDDGTAWQFVSDPAAENAACHNVILISGPTKVGSCVADSASGPFRLVKAAEFAGVPFVFGLATAASADGYVVRVLDANGDELAQDTTYEQEVRDGNSFAIPLPNDAVGPFTVELYDFDREWYDSTFDDRDGDLPYLKPGSTKVGSTTVTVEK